MKEVQRVATTPERIREAMEATGKKQIELAKETGLSHSTISRYLSGIVEPRQGAAIKLSKALGVSEMWLWGYDVPMTRSPEQKKNDAIVGVVSRLRADTDFFEVVSLLAELPAEQYASVKTLLTALSQK
jgi:transcriptional regulator with XRE-family HTH domain